MSFGTSIATHFGAGGGASATQPSGGQLAKTLGALTVTGAGTVVTPVTAGSWITAGAAYLIDSTPPLNIDADYTWMCWIKPTAGNIDGGQHKVLLSLTDAAYSEYFSLQDGNGFTMAARVFAQAGATFVDDDAPSAWAAGTWVHIAIRRNGSTVDLLVNGSVAATVTCAPGSRGSLASIRFGQDYVGSVAHVRAWSDNLSDGEVAAEMPSATAVRSSGLLIDQGTNEADGVGHDNSGNGNHMTETDGTFTFNADSPL